MKILMICLLGFCLTVPAQAESRISKISDRKKTVDNVPYAEVLNENSLKVIDLMAVTYGDTDWNDVKAFMATQNEAGPNSPVPLIALSHAGIYRYLGSDDPKYLAAALDDMEFISMPHVHRNWGMRWASPATASFLLTAAYRLKALAVEDSSLSERIDALWARIYELVAEEANPLLSDAYPYGPYWSGTPQDGDTKAEENAWVAYFLAMASQFFPANDNALLWEAKAKSLASLAIVRQSDISLFNGNQVVTVDEDFTLWNHGLPGNPYYTVGAVVLMRLGALSYRLTGQPVPEEFEKNILPLYGKYRSYCTQDSTGRWVWNIPSSPNGDPTLMPIPGLGDDAFERSVIAQKAADGFLWQPTTSVLKVIPDLGNYGNDGYGAAVQNGKVVWYYLLDQLWNFPPATQ